MMRDVAVETVFEDCPEGVVDAEIANEKRCVFDDLGITGDAPVVTSGDADQEEGVEV
jgi:hypothetical protein